ncbi:hypothetical protein RCKVOTHE_28 [Rhodobacter phage RcKvothe]|nr:hypothetical protein RCBAKA_30 [Rhodobacter phage RcBaka]QXN71016.1 hypothetical protein RCDORMIO_29 [Rhodobacter phage RcDormio]QXN71227.1 hypothetical protein RCFRANCESLOUISE_30 [Rhodobacter phage RcFrancesLouise]QXN71459.1 hypothetical protein RCHOTPOCKET_30 [Rhodobacter phage RcHotPocket]QXN71897.1 hypothetical protein RCOCEANUS_28 [Rhodobacter phage RcOceanus]UUV43905.1 hypothetical protein RCKVOTHE_28 [Rhodobacter phage RcKvothe]UUV44168.1 hypothetical protein RCMAMADUCK_29 [Rhodobac
MTTKVEIFAGHGVPVDVTPISRPDGARGYTTRIAAGAHGVAYVHSGADLLVREITPEELAAEAAATEAALKDEDPAYMAEAEGGEPMKGEDE